MTIANRTTAKLAVKYQQTDNGLPTLGALYALLNEQKSAAFMLMREILPDTLASTSELETIFDGSIWEVVQSENPVSINSLQNFFKIIKHNAAGIRRARTTAGPVLSVSDFCLLKAANSLPESVRDLWEKHWQLSVDDREELAVTMQQLQESFSEYSKSCTLHKRWSSLLIQEATTGGHRELPKAEFAKAAISFQAFHCQKQQEHQTAKLCQLVQQYQVEGSAQLFAAIYDNATVVKVAEEYRNYMSDPESYCSGQEMIHGEIIEMIIENALVGTLEGLPYGAELSVEFGSYIMAEFEYFIRMEERETEIPVSQQV